MTGIRHFTASAIVFDQQGQVLLIHHHKLGMWLYPGGHIDPNEDPAQAVVREVREETGVAVELVSAGTPFTTRRCDPSGALPSWVAGAPRPGGGTAPPHRLGLCVPCHFPRVDTPAG